MKKRTKLSWIEKMIAKALMWAAGKALEATPVIGPILKVIKIVNEVSEVRKSYSVA